MPHYTDVTGPEASRTAPAAAPAATRIVAARWEAFRRRHAVPFIGPPPDIPAAFVLHPGVDYRSRPAPPNEFWPNFDSAGVKHVIVYQVRPGFRLRCPVLRINLPGTERVQ